MEGLRARDEGMGMSIAGDDARSVTSGAAAVFIGTGRAFVALGTVRDRRIALVAEPLVDPLGVGVLFRGPCLAPDLSLLWRSRRGDIKQRLETLPGHRLKVLIDQCPGGLRCGLRCIRKPHPFLFTTTPGGLQRAFQRRPSRSGHRREKRCVPVQMFRSVFRNRDEHR